jgi:hypothetical protein
MSPEAEKFAQQVTAIDRDLGELIRKELERGTNLYALQDVLRKAVATKKAAAAAGITNLA